MFSINFSTPQNCTVAMFKQFLVCLFLLRSTFVSYCIVFSDLSLSSFLLRTDELQVMSFSHTIFTAPYFDRI